VLRDIDLTVKSSIFPGLTPAMISDDRLRVTIWEIHMIHHVRLLGPELLRRLWLRNLIIRATTILTPNSNTDPRRERPLRTITTVLRILGLLYPSRLFPPRPTQSLCDITVAPQMPTSIQTRSQPTLHRCDRV
jgi:hypothetical protein